MDNKRKNKISRFFKKEGFYVSLFLCICIIATVAAITARRNNTVNSKPPISVKDTEGEQDNYLNNSIEIPSNAVQVKETAKEEKAPIAQKTTGSDTVQAAAKVNLSFDKPVAGTLLLGFSELAEIEPTGSSTIQSMETVKGIYISAKIGQDVFAAENGVVVESTDAVNYGQVITIKHEDGYKTIYGNLSEKLNVKTGDKIEKGKKIATIGKTSNHYPSYKALSDGFLYFQVTKNDAVIDPATCGIKY